MSFLGDLFGGGAKQTSIATATSAPPSYAQPFLTRGLERAEEVYNTPREYFPGQTFVDFSPTTQTALDRGEARAMAGSPLVSGAQNFVNTAMQGGFLNPAAAMLQGTAQGDYLDSGNPYLSAALQPAIDQIQGQFSQAGRLGSGANMSAMTSALAPVYAQNYATERANQLAAQRSIGDLAQTDFANRAGAASMAPGMAAEDYTDVGRLAAFGLAREQKTAEQLADEVARYNFLQNEPQQRLANYMATIQGGTIGGQSSQPVYSDPTASAIGNIAAIGQGAKFANDAGLFDSSTYSGIGSAIGSLFS
jgi:hypothetical protein